MALLSSLLPLVFVTSLCGLAAAASEDGLCSCTQGDQPTDPSSGGNQVYTIVIPNTNPGGESTCVTADIAASTAEKIQTRIILLENKILKETLLNKEQDAALARLEKERRLEVNATKTDMLSDDNVKSKLADAKTSGSIQTEFKAYLEDDRASYLSGAAPAYVMDVPKPSHHHRKDTTLHHKDAPLNHQVMERLEAQEKRLSETQKRLSETQETNKDQEEKFVEIFRRNNNLSVEMARSKLGSAKVTATLEKLQQSNKNLTQQLGSAQEENRLHKVKLQETWEVLVEYKSSFNQLVGQFQQLAKVNTHLETTVRNLSQTLQHLQQTNNHQQTKLASMEQAVNNCTRRCQAAPQGRTQQGAPVYRGSQAAPLGRSSQGAPLHRGSQAAPLYRNSQGEPLHRSQPSVSPYETAGAGYPYHMLEKGIQLKQAPQLLSAEKAWEIHDQQGSKGSAAQDTPGYAAAQHQEPNYLYSSSSYGGSAKGNAYGNSYGSGGTGNTYQNTGGSYGNTGTGGSFGNVGTGNTYRSGGTANSYRSYGTGNTLGNTGTGTAYGSGGTGNTYGSGGTGNTYGSNGVGSTYVGSSTSNAYGSAGSTYQGGGGSVYRSGESLGSGSVYRSGDSVSPYRSGRSGSTAAFTQSEASWLYQSDGSTQDQLSTYPRTSDPTYDPEQPAKQPTFDPDQHGYQADAPAQEPAKLLSPEPAKLVAPEPAKLVARQPLTFANPQGPNTNDATPMKEYEQEYLAQYKEAQYREPDTAYGDSSYEQLSDLMKVTNLPRDCADWFVTGHLKSDIYMVEPTDWQSFPVSCDMATAGGGWTVLQRRTDGRVNFNRNWSDYARGFGTISGEHWLGLDNLYYLTRQRNYRLRIDLTDWTGRTVHAEYDQFYIDGADEKYRLHVSGYRGNANDSMVYHDGQAFSTQDRDNDRSGGHCAQHTRDRDNDRSGGHCADQCSSGWWFNNCHFSNLNGVYHQGGPYNHTFRTGIEWYHWKGKSYSLKGVEMKVRPSDF
ncbi:uncharacterized protein [Branchiostoma lanceolatum]|uniref:uncharacterized protein n=1 Tax=Branchiostoma lanceolatum TaxID=7740 RepID=UPI0034521AC5